ncbi:MAG: hypothetical protein ACPGVD_02295 [Flavobacteriales bacterium]
MKKLLYIIGLLLLFLFLTGLTQIGGIVLLLSLFISRKIKKKIKFKTSLIFLCSYLLFTFLVVPLLAPFFGREPIKHTANISATNYMTVILNRNYVRPEMNEFLNQTSKRLEDTKIEIKYLDANFPFIDKFPLPPHLSHNDGKKLDISLVYKSLDGEITNLKKSMSGYGVFAGPTKNEKDQISFCKNNGYFQYDYPKYMTFGRINNELTFSEIGTKQLIKAILKHKKLGKIFIEPHLKQRLKLKDSRIRYHGCGSVRHDDHIHIQLK